MLDLLPNAIEAADPEEGLHAQDLVGRLVQVQLGRRRQEAELRFAGWTGAPAALVFARDGTLEEAVAACERARARLLSDALQRDRLDLDLLAAEGNIDLVERFQRAAAVLDSAAVLAPDAPAGWRKVARPNLELGDTRSN
ncbi:hypothetical protein [Lentzea sp. NPDC004782]|uniref:hypothetical protein n=1 Tax=Lentzea sp. NPDC004782 TaxID=3154458 RepID=UPI0033AC4F76